MWGGCWRVPRHRNPKPSLWTGQTCLPPSSSRSSSKNWLPLHKNTPSYHTFLWKSSRVLIGLCDESNWTLKDFKTLFLDGFLFFLLLLSFSGTTPWRNLLDRVIYTTIFKMTIYFPSKDNHFHVLFNFIILALYSVRQPRRRSKLWARKSWPAWANNFHKSELQVHQPKTVGRRFLTKQKEKRLFFKQSSALDLNVFYNQLQPQYDVCCSVRFYKNTQVAFLECCCLIAVGLQYKL